MIFYVKWSEDSTQTILGRITAKNGTGAYTGVRGEGNWIKKADLTSITGKVFDLDGVTPDTPTFEFTVDLNTAILDIPDASGKVWTLDEIGFNFEWNLPITYIPTGGRRFEVEFEVKLTGGSVFVGIYKGTAEAVRGS